MNGWFGKIMANGIGRWNLVSFLIDQFGVAGKTEAVLITLGGVLLCMIIPYLLGSFNFGLIISKKRYNDDIRKHGSGNAGTTNMLRTYGKKAAVLTLLGDMLKAFVAVALGYLIADVNVAVENPATGEMVRIINHYGAAIAGLFVMMGHMFPIFYKFKGGKGVATSAMVVLMISPISFVFCFGIFVIIVVGTKFVSLGSCMGMMLYPIILKAFEGEQNPVAQIMAVFMALLVVFMHRENIKRLLAGTESKISLGKKKPAAAGAASADQLSDAETPAITESAVTSDTPKTAARSGKQVYTGNPTKAHKSKRSKKK